MIWPILTPFGPNLASRRLGMVMYGVFTINGHSPTPKWGQRNFTGNQAGISQSSCVKSNNQTITMMKIICL